jgi:hypothetical protein
MQSSSASLHIVPLRSKYCSEHPVLKHPQFIFSFRVRDQASHPYKTTGKLWFCMFQGFSEEAGRQKIVPNGSKHSANLLCS